jgi:quinol monooxygenase YgiN
MVVYEVNLTVDPSISEDFLAWLKGHVEEMLEFDGFLGAEIFAAEGASPPQYTVHYRLTDRQKLENYFQRHAQRMREDGLRRFPERFSATRRIFQPLNLTFST